MIRTIAVVVAVLPFIASAETRQTDLGAVEITPVVTGLNAPWGMAFLPEGGLLVTDREGAVVRVAADGSKTSLRGVPTVTDRGQGGLLDVLVPADFAQTRQVYLSYAKRQGNGSGTALGVGTLSADGTRIEGFRDIFEMQRGTSGGRHFGSRIVEGRDGFLYLTIGDRGDRDSAQDLGVESGTVVRVGRNGEIPSDNPFVGEAGAQPEIWSYGHRNPQGATLDAAGQLWVVEHGARGGDEVNRVQKGANYGWPVISYGTHYSGASIGEGTAQAGMEQPAHYWDPSIAPSGFMIYSGSAFSEWEGDFFVGSLKFDLISRLERQGDTVVEVERIKTPETERVRDVRQAPDGSIWFISEGNSAIYRMAPGAGG